MSRDYYVEAGEHCCKMLNGSIEDPTTIVMYFPELREYCFDIVEDDEYETFGYCPWCGTKLPKNLTRTWVQILEEEFGVKNPLFAPQNRIPGEFRTDQWWKKRGL